MKYLSGLILVLLFAARMSFAGSYAYIYIEGDRQTPFYVKLEGQMMPRLGKNYCILPNLAEGATNIEILFQQNAFPAQKFVVLVPEGGSRGFVLQKVNERQFALYDIQQGTYLVSGNTAADDHLPQATTAAPVEPSTPLAATGDGDPLPEFGTARKEPKKKKEPKPKEQPDATQADSRFIGDMELHPDPAGKSEPLPDFKSKRKPEAKTDEGSLAAINDEEPAPAPVAETPDTGMPNTDCRTPMSSEDFENFALKILDKTDDDGRIKVLSRNKGKQCFTTEQVRIIANNLETQSGRYEVVKMLYAQTSDQDNYPALESLFKTNYLKEKFREILSPRQ